MQRPIRLYPDPVLRRKAAPVENFDDALRELVAELQATMYAAPGVGLAATQIGELARVAVIDVDPGGPASQLHVLVNPRIVESFGETHETEGCLSIPEVTEKVERPERVRVEARDLTGGTFELAGEGLLARAICHEIDHLEGILFIDRLHGLRRQMALRRMKRLGFELEAARPAVRG